MIDIGRLNKRITLQRYTEVENEIGQTIVALTDFKAVWASVEPISGKEYTEADRNNNQLTYRIYIRYLEEVNADMIVNYNGRKFKITACINPRMKNELLQLVCVEQVDDIRGGGNGT